MKIAIPTNDNGKSVSEHFGRCTEYVMLDESGKVIETVKNTSEHMGGAGLPVDIMGMHNVNVLVCGGIGSRALELCWERGIDVYIFQAQTVDEMFNSWKNGSAKRADESGACKH